MAIIYSYPGATPTLSDTVLGTKFEDEGNPTKSFLISDILNLVQNITINTVSNPTSTALNLTTLNTLYPNAIIGFRVQCVNLSPPRIYEKTETSNIIDSDWVSYSVTIISA